MGLSLDSRHALVPMAALNSAPCIGDVFILNKAAQGVGDAAAGRHKKRFQKTMLRPAFPIWMECQPALESSAQRCLWALIGIGTRTSALLGSRSPDAEETHQSLGNKSYLTSNDALRCKPSDLHSGDLPGTYGNVPSGSLSGITSEIPSVNLSGKFLKFYPACSSGLLFGIVHG